MLQVNIRSSPCPVLVRGKMGDAKQVRLKQLAPFEGVIRQFAIYAFDRALRRGESVFVGDRGVDVVDDEGPAVVGFLGTRPETHRPRLPRSHRNFFCDGPTNTSTRPLPYNPTFLANNTPVPGISTTTPSLYDYRQAQNPVLCQQRHARGSATKS
jgi:hypothetical protein